MKPRFDFTLSLGDVLTALAILVAFVAGYVKLQGNQQQDHLVIGGMKTAQTETTRQITRVAVAMEMITHDLKSFPIHRHVPGGAIIYPAGPERPEPPVFLEQRERDGTGSNAEPEIKSGPTPPVESKKATGGGGHK
jgi:hypothetical protein